jgi:hypothetical protein
LLFITVNGVFLTNQSKFLILAVNTPRGQLINWVISD